MRLTCLLAAPVHLVVACHDAVKCRYEVYDLHVTHSWSDTLLENDTIFFFHEILLPCSLIAFVSSFYQSCKALANNDGTAEAEKNMRTVLQFWWSFVNEDNYFCSNKIDRFHYWHAKINVLTALSASIRVIYAILVTLEEPFEPILKHLFFYSEAKSIFLLVLTFGGHQGVNFIFELFAPFVDEKIVPRIRMVFLHSFVFVHGNVWKFCLPAMKNNHLEEMSNTITKYQTALSGWVTDLPFCIMNTSPVVILSLVVYGRQMIDEDVVICH